MYYMDSLKVNLVFASTNEAEIKNFLVDFSGALLKASEKTMQERCELLAPVIQKFVWMGVNNANELVSSPASNNPTGLLQFAKELCAALSLSRYSDMANSYGLTA